MWLNSRSRSNGHARMRLGGSLTGCDGTRSILLTILPLLKHSGVGGQGRAKSAVLNTLTSVSGQRTYDYVINDFVECYCSEPHLAFNRTVVLRYRIYLEQKGYVWVEA